LCPPIIGLGNQKGGTGKTTTAISVGHGLALRGNKVLLVDLDPQGHLAHLLNLSKSAGLKSWFCDNLSLDELIIEARPNLFVLPGDKTTEHVKGKIRDEFYGEQVFADRLSEETKGFDLVILDLAPSLDTLQVAALMSCRVLLIPTRLRFADLDGVSEILSSVQTVRKFGQSITPFILPTFFDRTTRETTLRLKEVNTLFGEILWPPIAQDIRVGEAPGHGMTIWEYAPNCQAVLGYKNGNGIRIGGYCDTVNRVADLFCLI
jgi:chromosome partitioning protein